MRTLFYILFLWSGCFLNKLHAQATGVKLNVILSHVQNLTINPAQATANLEYRSIKDYQDGVDLEQKNHIQVYSTSGYVVKVKLAEEEYTKLNGTSTQRGALPPLMVSAKPVYNEEGLTLNKGKLTTEGEPIISGNLTFNSSFDITYHGPGENSLVKWVEENKTTAYSNVVLYSIEVR